VIPAPASAAVKKPCACHARESPYSTTRRAAAGPGDGCATGRVTSAEGTGAAASGPAAAWAAGGATAVATARATDRCEDSRMVAATGDATAVTAVRLARARTIRRVGIVFLLPPRRSGALPAAGGA